MTRLEERLREANPDWKRLQAKYTRIFGGVAHQHGMGSTFGNGKGPDDFVAEAIDKIRNGTRNWPEGSSLESVLYWTVKSDISHWLKSPKSRVFTSLEALPERERPEPSSPNPEIILTAIWTPELRVSWLIVEIKKRDDKDQLMPILHALQKGAISEEIEGGYLDQLANVLKLPKPEVIKRMRRFRGIVETCPDEVPSYLLKKGELRRIDDADPRRRLIGAREAEES